MTLVGTLTVRLARTGPELDAVSAVLATVWGTPEATSPAPRNVLAALADTGGYVSGAWLDGECVGGSYGLTYLERGKVCLRSQVTGTTRTRSGIGEALKLHQLTWAHETGIERITWTFDPLVRANARFNVARLGARITRFVPDFYGRLDDGVNGGDATDRCVVTWDVGRVGVVAPSVTSAQLLAEGHEVLLGVDRSGAPVPHATLGSHLMVATPDDVVELRRTDAAVARKWRAATRSAFRTAFDAGLHADLVTADGWYRFRPIEQGS